MKHIGYTTHGKKVYLNNQNERVYKNGHTIQGRCYKKKPKAKSSKVAAKKASIGMILNKKKKSCFGVDVEPNEWGKMINNYTGRPMYGIPKNVYGYNGTQAVYGGKTGVVGYSGLGNQTIHLLPNTVSNIRRKR